MIIAVFSTSALHVGSLPLALLPLGMSALLMQRRVRSSWLLLPRAVLTWVLVHESSVHATIAGAAGFAVPVVRR